MLWGEGPGPLVKGVQGRTPAGVVNCCLVGDLWEEEWFVIELLVIRCEFNVF